MQELIIYLLKSSGLLAAFYLAYYFLLRKETFFTSNRWFLLTGLITSAVLPSFFIEKIVLVEAPKFVPNPVINTISNSVPTTEIIEKSIEIDWFQIGIYIYGIITLLLLFKVFFNMISLFKVLDNKQVIKEDKFRYIDINENLSPFSFFNYIVYNSSFYSKSELQSILLHEKIHSAQKHSFDVLLTNLFTIVFWFNPIVWFYKKAIVQNLEYIADNKAIQLIEDKKSYQKALLKVVSHQNCLPITNHFYQSLIKKRIVMLNKNQSNKRNSWKYAVIIPALVAFVLFFQIKVVAQNKYIDSPSDASQKEFATTPNTTSDFSNEEIGYVFDKISTDKELKMNIEDLKKIYNIDLSISNLKRNNKGEITTIKLNFDDNKGKKGTTEQNRNIPIRPIFFKVDLTQNTTTKTGFYNNSEMIEKQNDNEIENRISIIESIAENAEIYVDENRFSKEDILELDPKSIIKIDVLNDKKSLEKYKAKSKEIVVIKTNWIKPKPIENQEKNMLYIINGKEYFQKDVKGFVYKCDGSITHLVGKEAIEKYGTKGKDGVLVFNGNTVVEPNLDQENKTIIITVDNGEKILFMNNKNSVKIPGNPSVQIDDTLILIINGEVQKNAKNSIDNLNLNKIKTIKIEEEKDNSGTPFKKMIITTK